MARNRAELTTDRLIRTDFAPCHVDKGQLVPAAISSEDLKHRGFSVDRYSRLCLRMVRSRLITQRAKSPDKRKKSYAASIDTVDLRSIKMINGQRAFKAVKWPIRGNIAHAGIFADNAKPSNSEIKALKAGILPYLNSTIKPFRAFEVETRRDNAYRNRVRRMTISTLNFLSRFLIKS